MSDDGLIGYWGVVDLEKGISTIQGEMYSYEGRWIVGPKIYEDKEMTDLDLTLQTPTTKS